MTHAATTLETVPSARHLKRVRSVTRISLQAKMDQNVKHVMIVSMIVMNVDQQIDARSVQMDIS